MEEDEDAQIIDALQRLTVIFDFMENKFPVFGDLYYKGYIMKFMTQVGEWLNNVERKHGVKIRKLAYQELKFWDPFANTQTFFTTKTLEMLEQQALEKVS